MAFVSGTLPFSMVSTQRRFRPPVTCTAKVHPPREAALNRADFPILDLMLSETGKRLVYLDSAATSQKPNCVLEALREYYTCENANVHRGNHTLAERATKSYEEARATVARFVGAEDRDEIVFTRNATEAINLVSKSWGRANLKPGDVVVTSVAEHHANLVPWQMVAQETGATLKHVQLSTDGEEMYDVEDLKRILEEGGVKLVACAHVSNVLGSINPVADIVRMAHNYGARVLVDGCQSAPHMPVNVQELGCDFFVASGHKMCGPTGIGFLYGRRRLLEEMPPFLGGGEMIADVFLDHSTYASLPYKFEAGTPAIGEAVGLAAAVHYLESVGMENVAQYEDELGRYLFEQLSEFPSVRIYGPKTRPRVGLCAFNVDGIHPGDLSTLLDLEGVAIRSGHHCAQPVHRAVGVESSARASLYLYNNRADVDRFIGGLVESVSLLGGNLTRQ